MLTTTDFSDCEQEKRGVIMVVWFRRVHGRSVGWQSEIVPCPKSRVGQQPARPGAVMCCDGIATVCYGTAELQSYARHRK